MQMACVFNFSEIMFDLKITPLSRHGCKISAVIICFSFQFVSHERLFEEILCKVLHIHFEKNEKKNVEIVNGNV
jgi:hypothetical protein